jgi:uncharacterized protein YndB with AHSA1/START domain
MKKLEFKIDIAAPQEVVWKTMLEPETYKQWVGVSWPGSKYEGKWEKGETLKFTGSEGGGTQAKLIECKPYEFIDAKHIAVINGDGSLDTESDIAKGWIGAKEAYRFKPIKNGTELIVEITTPEAWEKMFSDGWPNALKKLKELSERKVHHAV